MGKDIIVGKDGAQWFRSVLDEILKLPLEHKVIWSFREAGKVFVLQKHKNYWGQYIAITEFGAPRNKWSVIITEGHLFWGWRGLGQVVKGLLLPDSEDKSIAVVVEPLQDPNEMQPAGSIKYRSKKFLFVPL